MANRLTNAGFLDLAQAWTGSAPLTLAVDETVRGDAGRPVLRATGVAGSGGETLTVQPQTASRAVVDPGELIETQAWAAAFLGGAAVTPTSRLVFRDSGGIQVSAIPLGVSDPALTLHGVAAAGLTETFHRVYGRASAPAGSATATLELSTTAAAVGQAVELVLLRPFLDAPPAGRGEPLPWDPGVQISEDLQLPIWPQALRPFQRSPGAEPKPDRIEFDAGPGRGAARRTSLDPARRFEGTMRCDAVQRAALEAFHRATPGDFWFVEPDSGRLCVASFAADGAPRAVEQRGPTTMMSVGLWLETF